MSADELGALSDGELLALVRRRLRRDGQRVAFDHLAERLGVPRKEWWVR